MRKKEKTLEIIKRLKKKYPNTKTALTFGNPWELMVATVLSAQCTDKQVNKVLEPLFDKFPSVEKFADSDEKDIQKIIHSTGFFRAKARSIKAASRFILENFNGEIPKDINKLIKVPGVGRKTASVVLFNGFGLNQGIAVDTHVSRIVKLIGLSEEKTPEKLEKDLLKIIPKEDYGNITNLLIAHGRETCIANRPKCEVCILRDLCERKLKN